MPYDDFLVFRSKKTCKHFTAACFYFHTQVCCDISLSHSSCYTCSDLIGVTMSSCNSSTSSVVAQIDNEKKNNAKVHFWSLQVPNLLRRIASYIIYFSVHAFPPMRNQGVTFFANLAGTKRAATVNNNLKAIMIRLWLRQKVIPVSHLHICTLVCVKRSTCFAPIFRRICFFMQLTSLRATCRSFRDALPPAPTRDSTALLCVRVRVRVRVRVSLLGLAC